VARRLDGLRGREAGAARVPQRALRGDLREHADDLARAASIRRASRSTTGIRSRAAAAPLAARGRRITYVGRLERYKNVDLRCGRSRNLAALSDAELAVVGQGADRGRLERLAVELGVAARVRFTGFLADAERDRLLASSRVCACASAKEGWGLTVIESNALGTPNVASDAPGLRDSVRHGETGFLVPVGDVEASSCGSARARRRRARLPHVGGGARLRPRFSWDRGRPDGEALFLRCRSLGVRPVAVLAVCLALPVALGLRIHNASPTA
jgi:glycosyltransferase involved in cell wall biosynthesis